MTYRDKWNRLRNEMKLALDEGFERGYFVRDDKTLLEHGYYKAYEYVMNKMDELDEED